MGNILDQEGDNGDILPHVSHHLLVTGALHNLLQDTSSFALGAAICNSSSLGQSRDCDIDCPTLD